MAPHLLPGGVGLEVVLRHHVDPVLITEVVPRNLVWVVTCPDGIDVVLLEGGNILLHVFHCNGPAAVVVSLVPVDPVDDQPLAIEKDYVIVTDLDPPEAEPVRYQFHQLTLFITNFH